MLLLLLLRLLRAFVIASVLGAQLMVCVRAGDLHAGNLLYTSSSDPVTVLDAGLTTSLSEDSWPAFQALLRLMCQGDAR